MFRFLSLFILALSLVPFSHAKSWEDLPSVRLMKLELPERGSFTVAYIGHEISGGQGNRLFAADLISEARKWIKGEYKASYPEIPASAFERMFELDDPLDKDSLMVIVMKGENAKDIQATLRMHRDLTLVRKAGELKSYGLPLERETGIELPRPAPKYERVWHVDPKTKLTALSSEPFVTGGAVELKYFVSGKNAAEDFVPLLFYTLEQPGDPGGIPHFVSFVDYPFLITEMTGRKSGRVVASSYLLECDKRMVPYYKRLGFKEVRQLDEHHFILEIDRKGFVDIWAEHFGKRSSSKFVSFRKALQDIEFEFSNYDKLRFRFGLGGVSCLTRALFGNGSN